MTCAFSYYLDIWHPHYLMFVFWSSSSSNPVEEQVELLGHLWTGQKEHQVCFLFW